MATKENLSDIMKMFQAFKYDFLPLPAKDTKWLLENPAEAIAIFINSVSNRGKKSKIKIGIFSKTVYSKSIPIINNELIVKNRYFGRNGEDLNTEDYPNEDFRAWYMDKKEGPFPAGIIEARKITKNTNLQSVLKALGGEEKVETNILDMFSLMSEMWLEKKLPNIFLIRDDKGILRQVRPYWKIFKYRIGDKLYSREGWNMNAYSIDKDIIKPGTFIYTRKQETT